MTDRADSAAPQACKLEVLVSTPWLGDRTKLGRRELVDAELEGIVSRDPLAPPNVDLHVSLHAAGALFSVARRGGECVITGFVLKAIDWVDGCVLTIPSHIDGLPVVELHNNFGSGRFMERTRWLHTSPPIGLIDTLVLPRTLVRTGRNVLSMILPRTIVGCRDLAEVDVSGLANAAGRQHPARRGGLALEAPCVRFSLPDDNPHLLERNGSLYSHDGSDLLFLALPYPDDLVVDEGVERIANHACVFGKDRPRTVTVPPSLATIEGASNPSCLWVCPPGSPIAALALERGWMAAREGFCQNDLFVYDVDDEGFARVIACKSATGHIEVPAAIDGHPVREVGNRAFPRDAESIVIAEGVRVVRGRNSCFKLRELVLPSTLEEVGPGAFHTSGLLSELVLPARLRRVAPTSFDSGAVRFEGFDAVVSLDPVFAGACFNAEADPSGPPFDFAHYDASLAVANDSDVKLQAMLLRLAHPCKLAESAREAFVAHVCEHTDEALDLVARSSDVSELIRMLDAGGFGSEAVDVFTSKLLERNDRTATAELLNYRHHRFGHVDATPGRFTL